MIQSKIKNVMLVVKACYYMLFGSSIVSIPKDIDEHETVLGCIIFVITGVFIFLFILIGLCLLFNYIFVL